MRRRGPRPLGAAITRVMDEAAPATLLAQVQRQWTEVAGPRVAAESEPRSERDRVVTVACSSAVWAQELTLLSADLLARLNASLGDLNGAPIVRSLKFVGASSTGGSQTRRGA